MPRDRQDGVKRLILFLILLPFVALLLSNTSFLLRVRQPVDIKNFMSIVNYYLQPTRQDGVEFFSFLWMLWPGLFLYLLKRKYISVKEHFFLQLFPFFFFLVYYSLQSLGLKTLAPFYYLPIWPSLYTVFQGLITGYVLALLLWLYLMIIGKRKGEGSPSKTIEPRAKYILLFCAGSFLLIFTIYFAMGFYTIKSLPPSGYLVREVPSGSGDTIVSLNFYRYKIMKAGIFFLTLWPPLTLWLICYHDIKRYRLLIFLVPIIFVPLSEILGKWLVSLGYLIRDVDLYYILLLKPVFLGYGLALLLGIFILTLGNVSLFDSKN